MRQFLFFFLVLFALSSYAITNNLTAFAVIAFHDVVDRVEDLDGDAVTTDRLVAFFEWLRGNDWHPISMDDIAQARDGTKPLPPRAILITFDDGFRSLYTRVYPLALAYRIPVVAALVGKWMDAPMTASVSYDAQNVPRRNFISWNEAREMQKSGFVEFASQGYDIHRAALANPQGNTIPVAMIREYSARGYESDAAYEAKMRADLLRSRKLMQCELGRVPRVLVWPYGRYTGQALNIAKALDFHFAFTLLSEPANITQPMAVSRYYPRHNPSVAEMVGALSFSDPLAYAQRLVCMDPALLWRANAQETDRNLGIAIERLRKLGATAVVLEAATYGKDGQIISTWFPNTQIPMRADVLSRIAWQTFTRAGVNVFIRMPHLAVKKSLGNLARVENLYHDLAVHVPMSGLQVEDAHFLGMSGNIATPWQAREARAAIRAETLSPDDRLALAAWRAVAFTRPGIRLIWRAPKNAAFPINSAFANLSLFDDFERKNNVKLTMPSSRRVGLWFDGGQITDAQTLINKMRAFQRVGGTAIGWCPDNPLEDSPKADAVAPVISASTFPVLF